MKYWNSVCTVLAPDINIMAEIKAEGSKQRDPLNSMFRQMRRKCQQLAEEESTAILQKATAGTLALLGDNDYPYAVPISYVYHEGKLYFHSALAGHKVDAIRKCDKASFCIDNYFISCIENIRFCIRRDFVYLPNL